MLVEGLAVRPLLDGYKAQRILNGGEEAIAQAPFLMTRFLLHLLECGDELIPLFGIALDPTDDDQHVA